MRCGYTSRSGRAIIYAMLLPWCKVMSRESIFPLFPKAKKAFLHRGYNHNNKATRHRCDTVL